MHKNKIDQDLISVKEIEAARRSISEVVLRTPWQKNLGLSNKFNCDLYLKREDLQVVRSFKIRGAYYKMTSLTAQESSNGVICASAGNHAQGVAYSCNLLGIKGKIFMPNPTPAQKIKKVKQFGGDWISIELVGDTFDESRVAAEAAAGKENKIFIHPFEDPMVIAGQGTIAAEILEDSQEALDYLLVAVGGGGLISGVGSYFKQLSPKTKIIAVEASGSAALQHSMEVGTNTTLEEIDTFADGIAVQRMGDLTFQICRKVVDQNIAVPEGKISSTILELYNEEAIVVEPAGAVSIAALDQLSNEIKGKKVGVIVCGGNNDIDRTQEIQERSMLYEGLKHYFIIKFPQRAGALRDFLNILGPSDDITHFQYTKKNNRESGPALVGIELAKSEDFETLLQKMKEESISFTHLNNDRTLFETIV